MRLRPFALHTTGGRERELADDGHDAAGLLDPADADDVCGPGEARALEEKGESLEECARRELREETGVEVPYISHFSNYSDPNRDSRHQVISIAYLAAEAITPACLIPPPSFFRYSLESSINS